MTTYRQFPQFPCSDFAEESQALAHRVLGVANTIFDIALESGMLEVPDRRACALALRHAKAPTPLIVAKVGYTFPDNKFREACFVFAQEKIERAMKHDDCTSYATRNEKRQRWGGGINVKLGGIVYVWGIAISGLREYEDEAIAVITAMYTFGIPFYFANIAEILRISENFEYTQKLLNRVVSVIGEPCAIVG